MMRFIPIWFSILLLVSCRSSDPEQRPSGVFDWVPGVGKVEEPDVHHISPGKGAQIRITNGLAVAGVTTTIAGLLMLAVPGVRQWGGATALSGIALAWLAIAFGHPLVPLLGFVFLVALVAWKIYNRIIKKNLQNN